MTIGMQNGSCEIGRKDRCRLGLGSAPCWMRMTKAIASRQSLHSLWRRIPGLIRRPRPGDIRATRQSPLTAFAGNTGGTVYRQPES
jgi:hypothetical protein